MGQVKVSKALTWVLFETQRTQVWLMWETCWYEWVKVNPKYWGVRSKVPWLLTPVWRLLSLYPALRNPRPLSMTLRFLYPVYFLDFTFYICYSAFSTGRTLSGFKDSQLTVCPGGRTQKKMLQQAQQSECHCSPGRFCKGAKYISIPQSPDTSLVLTFIIRYVRLTVVCICLPKSRNYIQPLQLEKRDFDTQYCSCF